MRTLKQLTVLAFIAGAVYLLYGPNALVHLGDTVGALLATVFVCYLVFIGIRWRRRRFMVPTMAYHALRDYEEAKRRRHRL
jgi:hypothetical protein